MRKPLILISAIPLVILAGGCSNDAGAPGATDSPPVYRLDASSSTPTESRGVALEGVVALTEEGCVVVESSSVEWPHGYTATTDGDGNVVVEDPSGNHVAAVGDTIEVGVIRGPVDGECASSSNGYVMVETPTVAQP